MDEETLKYFEKEPSIEELTREELIKALLKKHSEKLAPLKTQVKELKAKVDGLEEKREEARKARDTCNTDVASHKEKRQDFHKQANERRREFFVLMEKLDDLEKLDEKVEQFKDQLERMEWELQTTAITTSSEKSMLKKMHEIYVQLTEANKESQEKLGIQGKLPETAEEIKKLHAGAQEEHEALMGRAEESEGHHKLYRDLGKELSGLRLELRRAERLMENHKESKKYWKDWVGDKRA